MSRVCLGTEPNGGKLREDQIEAVSERLHAMFGKRTNEPADYRDAAEQVYTAIIDVWRRRPRAPRNPMDFDFR